MNAQEAFLKELTELSRKYAVEIAGCGCCGSPWLQEIESPHLGLEYGYTYRGQGEQLVWTDMVKDAEEQRELERIRQEHEKNREVIISQWDDEPIYVPKLTSEQLAQDAKKYEAWKASLK